MSFNISKISLGSSAKKHYNHNLSFDNNTTFDFGSVQPLMCQYLLPNSDINVNYRQLVRLAPMVAPTFGRMHLQNEVSFVPLADVVPYSEALFARMSYSVGNKTYKPISLPYTNNAFLVYWLLICTHSNYTYWFAPTTTGGSLQARSLTDTDISSITSLIQQQLFGKAYSNFPTLQLSSALQYDNYVSFESADFVIKFSTGSAITFKLNNTALRLRKILIGLGYSLNMTDRTNVSFAPILAFYKAWFDLYAVKRSKAWNNTFCYALIKYIDDNYFIDFTQSSYNVLSTPWDTFFRFMQMELQECWYTFDDDFVSVHRSSPQLTSLGSPNVHYLNAIGDTVGSSPLGIGAEPTLPIISDSNSTRNNLSNVGLQVLQRLSRYVNKDSVIGQRMTDWLRVHFGADVANSLFKQTNHINSSRLDLEINDVFNLADTASGSGDNATGEVLGAYAGKGLGFNKHGFSFHANTSGFVFVLSSIVPSSGYYQGNDTQLYGLDNDTLPNPDFDAVGFELTPKGAIASDNNIFISDGSADLTNKGFGFIPRFSGFKVKKNIVNGDMSRRGTINTFNPYYLDRILTETAVTSEHYTTRSGIPAVDADISTLSYPIPSASENWRYCARYPWLGNYNRIFYRSGTLYKGGSASQLLDNDEVIEDNFICQSVFDVRVSNFLKPISQSYDTYEESSDTSTYDVKAE